MSFRRWNYIVTYAYSYAGRAHIVKKCAFADFNDLWHFAKYIYDYCDISRYHVYVIWSGYYVRKLPLDVIRKRHWYNSVLMRTPPGMECKLDE